MKQLKQNIIGIFGEKGRSWLANLPVIVKKVSEYWSLRNVIPVENMSFNFVAKALDASNFPVVLKISCDDKLIRDEIQALSYFEGHGSIKLLGHNTEYNALLLQQAVPGYSLKSLYPAQVEFVLDCYAATVKKLHEKPFIEFPHYPHMRDWLTPLDTVQSNQLPAPLLKKSRHLKERLLETSNRQFFLHGDLHLDNILKNDEEWLTIDPKGIVGDPEFEVAAFDFISSEELINNLDVKSLFESRIKYLAEKTDLNAQRIKDWVYVRLALSAAWWIEDHGDPNAKIQLINSLF